MGTEGALVLYWQMQKWWHKDFMGNGWTRNRKVDSQTEEEKETDTLGSRKGGTTLIEWVGEEGVSFITYIIFRVDWDLVSVSGNESRRCLYLWV